MSERVWAWGRLAGWWRGWALAAALLSVLGGACRKEDYRMSFGEFQDVQRRMQNESSARVAELEPLNPEELLKPFTLGPGDVVGVSVRALDQPDVFPGVVTRVRRDGTVDLPTVGRVSIAGLELEDAESKLHEALVPAVVKNAVVHLEMVDAEKTQVLVTGGVTTPGLVELERNQRNLLYAIVAAGGVSQSASGAATLRRLGRPTEEVTLDLADPVQQRAALRLDPLERGDTVYVHSASPNTLFVGGLVNRVAPQNYPSGIQITALQVLASAGGLRTDVFPKEATLIRRMPDGSDAHVKIDLDRLAHGQDNFALAAGDILWVPHTWQTRVQEFINETLFVRAGVTFSYNVFAFEPLNRRGSSNFGGGGGTLQNSIDPLGFLSQPAAAQPAVTTP